MMMNQFVHSVRRFGKSEAGPTAVEYAVMLAMIVVISLASVRVLGTRSSQTFRKISRSIKRAGR